jgi:V8-like Glu-specific endopeptidase
MTKTFMTGVAALAIAVSLLGARPASAADDPCTTRQPTELDLRSDWRCVGLADSLPDEAQPDEVELTPDQLVDLEAPHPADWDLGVAVSPDGRLFEQVLPSPTRVAETRSYRPAPDVDPEGEPATTLMAPGRSQNKLFGADNRQIRTATTSYPWRALTAVLPPGSTVSTCSGVLIGPRQVLTAGHCVHKGGGGGGSGWYRNLKAAPGMDGVNTFPNGLKNRSWYFSVKGWVNHKNPNYDYGMIVLQDRDDTAHLGWFGWRSSGHSGGIWNFGYPYYTYTCADSPRVDRQCWDHLYGDDNSVKAVWPRQLRHEADTQKGQSGSPVYKYNGGDRRVIGVHAYAGNYATRIVGKVSDNLCEWIHDSPSAYNDHECE